MGGRSGGGAERTGFGAWARTIDKTRGEFIATTPNKRSVLGGSIETRGAAT